MRIHCVNLLLILAFSWFLLSWPGMARSQDAVVYSTQENYEQVKENLEFAIINQGLLIRGVMKIGEMLDNTRNDLGYERVLLQGHAFDFCSAQHTYAMIAVDPRNIVNCPFSVAVYVTLEQPDIVYVAYRIPRFLGAGSEQTAAALAAMLDTIARDAVAE